MKKVLWFCAAMFVIALGMGVSASAETKKIGNFKYEYDSAPNGNDIWITQITPVTGSDISTLKIPSKIDGNKVIKLGAKDDTDDNFYNNIFGMSISEEDNNLVPEQIVSDVAKIKKIVLPSGLKELTPNCFHSIQKGKTISLPKTLEKDISALYNLQWKKVTINKGNKKYKMKSGCILSKSGKTFYSYLETKRSVKIPNGVKTIAERALYANKNLKSVYIPKTVTKIKGEAFSYMKKIQIKIASKNKYYFVSKGCVVSRRTGRLVVATAKKGVITIPEKVTVLKEGTFFAGGECDKIIFPKTLKKICSYWNTSLVSASDIKLVFHSKVPPVRERDAYLPYGGVVYVPKGKKQVYKKAMKKFGLDLKIVEK